MREYKSFFKTVGGNEGSLCHYSTRLDTYGCGCQHDCNYCYAKSLLEFRGLWDPKSPSVADIGKVRKRLDKLETGSVIRMGGMTDCFQPMEKRYGVTYETLRAMNNRGIGYLIVTKSALVADEKYIGIYDKDLAHIQITITSADDKTAQGYEKASPVSERIAAAEKLQRLGFDVCVRLPPYIPGNVDIDAINAIKCDKILVEFLRCNGFIRKTFPLDYSEYTLKHGGYWHLPLDKKLDYLRRIKKEQISVCDDVPEHYEYFKANVNYNADDCCNLRRSND